MVLFLLVSCSSGDVNPFFIKTSDGVKLSTNFFSANSDKGVVLLHMLDRSKSDWDNFIPVLTNAGYNVVAIDLRGHGASELDWSDFSSVEFSRAVLDVSAAVDYLRKKDVSEIGVIGASIGANIALKHASQEKTVKSLILLSPSLDYRGVETGENIDNYEGSLFIVTSKEDSQSADDSLTLYESASGEKKFIVYDNAGHGTNMFSEESLSEMILEWLDNTI